MSEPKSMVGRVVRGVLLIALGAGCAGPSDGGERVAATTDGPSAARVVDAAADGQPSRAEELPSWLDDAHPSRQLDGLTGAWRADVWITRRTGRVDHDGPLDLLVAPLLEGRLLLGLWTGTLAQRPQSGLSALAWNGERLEWELVGYWPVPGEAGFELAAGTFRHGRLQLLGRQTDARGRSLASRTTLADISPVSLRWDQAVSADEGLSWATDRVLELRRQGPSSAAAAPDLDDLLARDAACATSERAEGDLEATFLLGRWTGSLSRLQPDGRWTSSPCRYEASALLDGRVILDRLQEQGADGQPGFARVALWGRLAGAGRRLDRKSWEVFRRDDRSARTWSFAGDFDAGAGEFVHPDEQGRPQVRLALELPEAGSLEWVESTSDDGGASWTERVRIALVRDA